MAKRRNDQLELFRQKCKMLLSQHVEKMKIFIAEEAMAKTDMKEIRRMREDPESPWATEREALVKDLKREAAGMINRIHIETYRQGMK